jgi:SAM-dependent methyltransferase
MPSMSAESVRVCPLCERSNASGPASRFSSGEWIIRECSCGMVYLENAPRYEALEETFAWEKTAAAETERREAAEPVVQTVSRAVKQVRKSASFGDKLTRLVETLVPDGVVVDIGCAKGGVLRRISAPRVVGIEISKELAKRAGKNLKEKEARIVQADAVTGMKGLTAGSAAGVIMSAFLEHEAEPATLLREVARVLQADGLAIIKVPNFGSWNRKVRGTRWCGFRYPDHVNYFTPDTLKRLCEKCGLKPVRFGWTDRLPTNDNMWMVVGRAA